MNDALDKLIPLAIAPIAGAALGWLVSIATGYTAIAITIGAFAGLAALILLGTLLPPEPTS